MVENELTAKANKIFEMDATPTQSQRKLRPLDTRAELEFIFARLRSETCFSLRLGASLLFYGSLFCMAQFAVIFATTTEPPQGWFQAAVGFVVNLVLLLSATSTFLIVFFDGNASLRQRVLVRCTKGVLFFIVMSATVCIVHYCFGTALYSPILRLS